MSGNVWEWVSDWCDAIIRTAQRITRQGPTAVLTGRFAAAVGTSARGACAQLIASTSPRPSGAATLASGSSGQSSFWIFKFLDFGVFVKGGAGGMPPFETKLAMPNEIPAVTKLFQAGSGL